MQETSALLKKTRMEKNLTLEEISAQTKIQLHILTALEEGHLDEFRSPTYTRGFLRQYAKALGLDQNEVLRLFEQEQKAPPVTNPLKSAPPVAKLDDNEIQNKTNVLWFRTSSKWLTLGGVLVIFALITAIYFFSMKLLSYSQETHKEPAPVVTVLPEENKEVTEAAAEEPPPKEESLSLPQKAETVAPVEKTPEKKETTPAETGRPKMVTVEAFENVEIQAFWSTGKKEEVKLKNNGKHIFYYADKLKLEISNGGGVGITTHAKEVGVPGELGKPATLNFD